MICPNCGKDVEGKFCNNCGASLSETPIVSDETNDITIDSGEIQKKKKKKKIIIISAVAAAIILLIIIIACIGNDEPDYPTYSNTTLSEESTEASTDEETTTKSTEPKTVKVADSISSASGYFGQSACTGLYKTGNTYKTDDGRFEVSLGKAAVISDGSKQTVKAITNPLSDRGCTVFTTDLFGDEAVGFVIPNNKVQTGRIYPDEKLKFSKTDFRLMSLYQHSSLYDAIQSDIWVLGFATSHNDSYMCPTDETQTEFKHCFLRIIYCEENNVAVCYMSVEYTTSPKSIEVLAAFDLSQGTPATTNGGNANVENAEKVASADGVVGHQCSVCRGTGKVTCGRCTNGKISCPSCHGVLDYNLPNDIFQSCSRCGNSGKIDCDVCNGSSLKRCSFCGGDGKM